MKIKIYYRKNLKLSPQKLATVCTHTGKELGKVCGDTISLDDGVEFYKKCLQQSLDNKTLIS